MAKSTANQHIRFFRFCSAYPILLSTGYEFSVLSGYQDAIEKFVKKDAEFGDAMSSTASIPCRIEVPALIFESLPPAPFDDDDEVEEIEECDCDAGGSVGSAGLANLNLNQ